MHIPNTLASAICILQKVGQIVTVSWFQILETFFQIENANVIPSWPFLTFKFSARVKFYLIGTWINRNYVDRSTKAVHFVKLHCQLKIEAKLPQKVITLSLSGDLKVFAWDIGLSRSFLKVNVIRVSTCTIVRLNPISHAGLLSVDHHLAEHNVEEFSPSVGNSCCLDVDVPTLHGFRAVKVKPGVEEGSVLASDYPTLGLRREGSKVQFWLIWDVHRQTVQIVYIVRVGSDLVCNVRD